MKVTEYLNKEYLYSTLGQEYLFKYYIGNFKSVGTKFKSELRTDPNPSCIITSYNGVLWYKDFGTTDRAVDVIGYVELKHGLSYKEALARVAHDFNIDESKIESKPCHISTISKREIEIKTRYEFKVRNYLPRDSEYWGQYGLEETDLKFFDIYPIQWLRIIKDKTTVINDEKFMYVYIIDNSVYKFLSPYSDFKWLSNCTSNHMQGWNQLPESGDLLLITKSLKDVAVLHKLGYTALAPASESQLIPKSSLNNLRKRFKKILLFYDNDTAGIAGANKNSIAHKLDTIMIPIATEVKDISDYVKYRGIDEAKNLMLQLLW